MSERFNHPADPPAPSDLGETLRSVWSVCFGARRPGSGSRVTIDQLPFTGKHTGPSGGWRLSRRRASPASVSPPDRPTEGGERGGRGVSFHGRVFRVLWGDFALFFGSIKPFLNSTQLSPASRRKQRGKPQRAWLMLPGPWEVQRSRCCQQEGKSWVGLPDWGVGAR